MTADLLITGISQLVTAKGSGAKHGPAMRELHVTERAAIAICNRGIIWTGKERDWSGEALASVDVGDRAVVPGLIDPHTHAVWAGNRLADFDARTSGKTYEAILAAGGGIRRTIRATAAATKDELLSLAEPRIRALLQSGATTVEVKSGYGFTPATEIAMLEVIQALAARTPARLLPTLLIHIPPASSEDRPRYITEICTELIPEVARRQLATAVDIFVEKEAFHVDEATLVLQSAKQHNLAVKLHTEQFQCIGGLELGVRMGVLSVDHLETCGPEQLAMLAASSTIATILPGVSLHLGIPAAPGRQLVDAGAAVAVGTDLNPGSSPLFSAAAALALAVRLNGLTAQEALVAGTVNAACALGLADTGRLEVGLQADFLVLEGSDWRELVYTLGGNPVREVWIRGERL
ncbi:imidazolonepropionase [Edaphobacter aggregans]|uniref:imidazolonepropionase n=1 Tax=Edaphobacter aggregans TaxID=570835 RepID=UPI0005554C68|nr:imidazolonepropionase [Edaphobacter aggregans]